MRYAILSTQYLRKLVKTCMFFSLFVAGFVTLRTYQEDRLFDTLLNGPLSMYDPQLISYIESSLLVAPGSGNYDLKIMDMKNPANVRYNRFLTVDYGFSHIMRIIQAIFDNRPPGFFIEAGALDGEFLSNTLYLEMEKGWTGLLVEPNKKMFKRLLQKNRKSWAANCCLSTTKYPSKETLITLSDRKGPGDDTPFHAMNHLKSVLFEDVGLGMARQTFDKVQCVPFLSLLKALDVKHVDFVSLDVEGVETEIVDTVLKYNKDVEIDVWILEHYNRYDNTDVRDDNFIENFREHGYSLYTITTEAKPYNYVFIRKGSRVHNSAFSNRPKEFVVD